MNELTQGQINYRKYRKGNKELAKKYRDRENFSGKRTQVLERDNYSCQKCGMTNEEHLKKWNKEITIDHIDGRGRNSDRKNNNMENLITLCLSCHAHKDGLRTHKRILEPKKEEIIDKYIRERKTLLSLAKEYGTNSSVLHKTLKRWGIQTRNNSMAQKDYMSNPKSRENIALKMRLFRAQQRDLLKSLEGGTE